MTDAAGLGVGRGRQPNKYGARRVEHGDHTHDSEGERSYCYVLQQRERLGGLRALAVHPIYILTVNGQKVCSLVPDWEYHLPDGTQVVVDFKSPPTRTPVWRLKVKLLEALTGIRMQVVE